MSASAPNNAVLANAVRTKDLTDGKKHLEHVAIEKAEVSQTGGVHMGPGKGQADFAATSLHSHQATSVSGTTSTGGNSSQSSHSGEVSVQSSVTIDTTIEQKPQAAAQIQSLLSRLSTTTSQVDDYSRRANEKISADANKRIQSIIADTQVQQDALLRDASARALEIEGEYSTKLKAFLQELDASKAGNLAALEKDLNFRQDQLLNTARDDIDRVHQDATQQKIGVMQDANRSVLNDVDRLTEQVKTLGEAEVERRMNSTTTTVITTQTSTESHADMSKERTTTTTTDKDIRVVQTEPRTSSTTRI